MLKIDNKDRKILNLLERNSRESLSKTAKKLRLSPQSLFYRINRLVSEKVILGFPTIIDHAFMNLIEVNVYFKISYISEKKLEEIIKYFSNHESIVSVVECGGNWDLIVTYLVENLSQFNKILHKDIQEFPKQLTSYDIMFTIATHFFLPNVNFKKHIIIGGDREPMKFKTEDMILLYNLSSNSRMSILDLSREIGKDPKTVLKRINSLKKLGIIKDYTLEIDHSKTGYSAHVLLISYHDPTAEEEKEFLDFIRRQEEITTLKKLIGEYNVALTLKVKNEVELRRLLFRLKEKFSDIIYEVLDIPIYYVPKRIYLPKAVME